MALTLGLILTSTLFCPVCTLHRYEGPTCSIDINECVRGTSGCASNAGCINSAGSYHCKCFFGYSGAVWLEYAWAWYARRTYSRRPCSLWSILAVVNIVRALSWRSCEGDWGVRA